MLSFSNFINNLSRANKLVLCGLVSVGLSVMSFSNLSYAADQGTIGETSTGSVNLSVNIPSLSKISGLSDFDFGDYSGSGGFENSIPVCVFNNNLLGEYTLTANDGVTGSSTFTLVNSDDSSGSINYKVRWGFNSTTVGAVELEKGVAITGYAAQRGMNCELGGKNSTLIIAIEESDIAYGSKGAYSGVLTFVIAAQ